MRPAGHHESDSLGFMASRVPSQHDIRVGGSEFATTLISIDLLIQPTLQFGTVDFTRRLLGRGFAHTLGVAWSGCNVTCT